MERTTHCLECDQHNSTGLGLEAYEQSPRVLCINVMWHGAFSLGMHFCVTGND